MSTNDSDNGARAKATEKQLTANRANAKKSTGPKSAAGKLAVARNGIGHGIYALCPVIEDVESAREWKRYRGALLASLAPVGMLETTLAERIILTTWRQRRAVRYETEQIRLTQERATEVAGVRVGLERETAASDVEDILSLEEASEQTWQTIQAFAAASDDTALSQDDADNLLWHSCEQVGVTLEGFDDYWQQLREPEVWTAGVICQLVRALAEQHGKSFDELLAAIKEKTTAEFVQYRRAANQVKRELDEYRRENLLPDDETLERVQRFEAHLGRAFHRDLHELQRLQALRQGLPVAAPLVIDLDVSGGPKAELNTDE